VHCESSQLWVNKEGEQHPAPSSIKKSKRFMTKLYVTDEQIPDGPPLGLDPVLVISQKKYKFADDAHPHPPVRMFFLTVSHVTVRVLDVNSHMSQSM
jgi:hypothetical protein